MSLEQPLFRFGLIADVQYADDEPDIALDRHFRASPGKLSAAIAEFERHQVSFAIHLGDLIDHDLANAAPILELMDASSVEFRQVLGNHDFSTHRSDTVNDQQTVCRAFGMAEPYYAFDLPGWRFLVLDTNQVGVIATAPGTPAREDGDRLLQRLRAAGRPNANPWNGTIGPAQRDWLADQLTDAEHRGLRAMIFAHHPVFPDHHDNLLDDQELRDWLADFGALAAWVNGHQHQGGYGSYRGVHYLTLSGVLQTADSNAYAIAEVYADRIEITGYDREPSRTLKITVAG
ncbi:metallophosphoesterase [Microlunatus soli]|uniref:3',5'-cyclic AMP phosphodiesterase CpdA n=1 Tax=Microlunatus soli TaxID=630515 RepID=A0A1H1ZCJ5_9ACTN|nr:metallophosphoesterase [Microlunatus soli]SDT30916.1 3',5'-cyclic AMP phosphodiesterase CpdA [Microlunatus soli]